MQYTHPLKHQSMFMLYSVAHSSTVGNQRRQGLVLMKPPEAHDCTNLTAISQAGPWLCCLLAPRQMKGMWGARYMKRRMRESGFAQPSHLAVLSKANEHSVSSNGVASQATGVSLWSFPTMNPLAVLDAENAHHTQWPLLVKLICMHYLTK